MDGDVTTAAASRGIRADEIVQAVLSGRVGLDHLDELVRSAAVATWSPVALISMITGEQVTASAHRVSGAGPTPARGDHVPLEDSVCVHALRSGGPVRITDARCDERVAGIPATVAGEFGSYLGIPLHSAGGDTVGVLCVYDTAPRAWTEAEEQELDGLARQVAAELRRIAADHGGFSAASQ